MDNPFIKDRIKKYRQIKGLTQAELASLTHISLSNISKYETGNRVPKTDYLIKIAEALRIPLSALISSKDLGEEAFENLLTELNCSYYVYQDVTYGESGAEDDILDYEEIYCLLYNGNKYYVSGKEFNMFQEDVISYTSFKLEQLVNKARSNQEESDKRNG